MFSHISPNHPLNTLLPSQSRLRGCAVNGCSCVVAFFSSVSVYRTFHAVDLAMFKNSHKLKINLHHTTDRHPYIELVRARGLKGVLTGGTTHTKQHDPHIHTIYFPLPPLPALGKQISYRNVCNTKKKPQHTGGRESAPNRAVCIPPNKPGDVMFMVQQQQQHWFGPATYPLSQMGRGKWCSSMPPKHSKYTARCMI